MTVSDDSSLTTINPDDDIRGYALWPNKSQHVEIDNYVPCLFAPYYVFSCVAALVACSVFLRVGHMLKLVGMLVGLIGFNVTFHVVFKDIFDYYDEHMQITFLPAGLRGTIDTTVMFLTLVVLDRQIEQNLRLDYMCRMKINEEKKELRRKELYNELLLANILPKHVAEHFMQKRISKNELYHQHCKNACVMFAAMPDFVSRYAEHGMTGKEFITALNETISEFDRLLSTKQFQDVEKMKTIGTTYMAATGLRDSDCSERDEKKLFDNVMLMVSFAGEMMDKLKERSRHTMIEHKMRIGLHHGEVVAGVIGAQKPQYDIWGDAVNVASRMESNGVLGKIQVPESTAILLQKNNIMCHYRDTINVKGKGQMKVFLVPNSKLQTHLSINSTDPANIMFHDMYSSSSLES